MDVRHLQHFLAVIETGSFHAAAKRLNLTQQAISRSIQALEGDLGVRLLERKARDRRGIGPTAFGRLLIPRAQAVVTEMRGLRDQFDNLIGDRHTLVRFAAAPSPLRRLVPEALQSFYGRRADMRVQVMRLMLPSIIERLAEGAYDFVICDEPDEPLEASFAVEPLLEDECIVVSGSGHRLAGLAKVEPGAFSDYPWVGPGPFLRSRRGVNALLERAGSSPPSHLLETSDLGLVIDRLMRSEALAVLPRQLVAPELADGSLAALPVSVPEPAWQIVLVSRADYPRSPAVEDFLDALRTTAGTLAV